MNPLPSWWDANRRWLVPVLLLVALVVVVGTLAQTTNYLTGWLAQRAGVKQVNQTLERNAVRVETDRNQQKDADSLIHTLAGRQQEQARASHQSKIEYEATTIEQPAIPDLPRNPPRFRPGGR